MKTLLFLMIFGLCTALKVNAQETFLGFWENEEKTQIVEIYITDSSTMGKLHIEKR